MESRELCIWAERLQRNLAVQASVSNDVKFCRNEVDLALGRFQESPESVQVPLLVDIANYAKSITNWVNGSDYNNPFDTGMPSEFSF